MSDPEPEPRSDRRVDPARARRILRLRVTLKLMSGVGVLALLFVFVSAFLSGEDDERALPRMRVAIGDIAPGETRLLTWDGRPLLVHRRTGGEIARLRDTAGAAERWLRDPVSGRSEQPEALRTPLRSVDPEWFVAIALGTDYGCPVAYLPPDDEPFAGVPWPGGFADGCRGSRYDLAGRVYRDQYADRNLVVPRYRLEGGELVLGGL